ncbi:MAG: hypothetical protein LRY36_02525 [Alphaproteobacteria bacterium]|nr:hypothetical protein [Alphaproteobacteria bacterium]
MMLMMSMIILPVISVWALLATPSFCQALKAAESAWLISRLVASGNWTGLDPRQLGIEPLVSG